MTRDGCNYFSFWAIFRPFTPLRAQKIKVKKFFLKNPAGIIILHTLWLKNKLAKKNVSKNYWSVKTLVTYTKFSHFLPTRCT